MEKNSITIEIKREAAIMLVWLVVGVTLVTVGFLYGFDERDLWSSLNTAGALAGLYLVALILYSLRKPISLKTRVIVGVFSALMLFAIVSTWNGQYKQSHWQRVTMLKMRTMVGRNIIAHKVPDLLLKTLDTYYQQGSKQQETLGKIFQRLNPGAVIGANIYKPQFPGDNVKISVQSLADREIILIGQDGVAKGKNPQFKNYDGSIGMMQEKFILTEKGIVHESQN